jgi:Ankyrin repeats (3 copies)
MSAIFNSCDSISRYVPDTGAEDIIRRISDRTTVKQFEQMCKRYPQFQLWQPDWHIRTVLHTAAIVGNVELIEYLVKRAPELLERGDRWGSTPLCLAAENNQPDAVRTLLALGANSNIIMLNIPTESNATKASLLHTIALNCLEDQNDPKLKNIGPRYFYFMQKTDMQRQILKLLLEYGAERHPNDDNEYDQFTYTPNKWETIGLPAIKSIIESASQDMAEEREETRGLVQMRIDRARLLPRDLGRLVSEYI